MRMDENDSFFKLKEQLEDAQKLMGRMEQYIVEARGVLQSCIRRQSEFQPEFRDCAKPAFQTGC